jgi:hypothetical protein
MANLTAQSTWSDVPQLETNTPAMGGPGGPMNLPAQALLNRTQWLLDNLPAQVRSVTLGTLPSATDTPLLATMGLLQALAVLQAQATAAKSSGGLTAADVRNVTLGTLPSNITAADLTAAMTIITALMTLQAQIKSVLAAAQLEYDSADVSTNKTLSDADDGILLLTSAADLTLTIPLGLKNKKNKTAFLCGVYTTSSISFVAASGVTIKVAGVAATGTVTKSSATEGKTFFGLQQVAANVFEVI